MPYRNSFRSALKLPPGQAPWLVFIFYSSQIKSPGRNRPGLFIYR